MKTRHIGWVLLGLLALLALVSCKSTPAQETPPPPEPEVVITEQPSLDDLEAAEDRALAAQKLISDFEGPSSYPDDWRAASALLTEADRRKNTSSVDEIKESTARYIKAAEAFEGMSGKVLERFYEKREAELIAARNIAIEAGAEELIPELLEEADDTVALAVEKYEARDYYAARNTAADALSMYEILKLGFNAFEVREIIAERNFEEYDPRNVETADDTLRAAADDYSAKNFAGARDKIEAARLRYNLVLRTAWESYAADKAAEAADDRQEALNIRANIASRQEFNTAQDAFNRANTAFRSQRFDEAAIGFEDSIKQFASVITLTRAKRAAAEQALERANQRMAESDEKARNAEIILEGGE